MFSFFKKRPKPHQSVESSFEELSTQRRRESNIKSEEEFAEFKSINDKKTVRQLVKIDPLFSSHANEFIEMIADSGMILEGHFSYIDGLHAINHARFANFTRHTAKVAQSAEWIVERLIEHRVGFDAILASENTASILAGFVIRACDSIGFPEPEWLTAKTEEWEFPSYIISPETGRKLNVLLVDGIVVTPRNLEKLGVLAEKDGHSVAGAVVFATQCGIENYSGKLLK